MKWSDDHLKVIEYVQKAVFSQELFAYAMPRGSGKSTIAECASIFAALNGHWLQAMVGASQEAANELLASVRTEIETNDELLGLFPEICYPVRCLEGIVNRARGQTYKGQQTRMVWGKRKLAFPTIEGSPASGAVIMARGLLSQIRGMKVVRSDGTQMRPSFVVCDDPQTDQSAKSKYQTERREMVLRGAVLGLAGPGKSIAGVMTVTVMREDDLASRMLDRKRNPEWHGYKTKLLYSLPTRMDLWEQYYLIHADEMQTDGDGSKANAFYKKNRKAMDAGAKVAWAERYNKKKELSAIQHAMNLRAANPHTFGAEFNNEPSDGKAKRDTLTPQRVLEKLNGLPFDTVPLKMTRVVAHIDVQHSLLYWATGAFNESFSGCVLNHDAFPKQGRHYFSLRDASETLQQHYEIADTAAAVRAGLRDLVAKLLTTPIPREDGVDLTPEIVLIDCQDGTLVDHLYEFIRTSPHARHLRPAHGKGIGPAQMAMPDYKTTEGEILGEHWLYGKKQKRLVRALTIDTNWWKSEVHRRLKMPLGANGSIEINGNSHGNRMFADHVCSEESDVQSSERTGRSVRVWKLKPGETENHHFDNLVGLCVAASVLGCKAIAESPRDTSSKRTEPRRRVHYYD